MGDAQRTPDDSEIIGFHGITDHDGMRKIGVVMRYTLEAPIFSNCWVAYAKRKQLEEEEYKHPTNVNIREEAQQHARHSNASEDAPENNDDNASVSNDESQFAAVLRMRNCDILQALARAQKFVRRLRRSPSVPTELQPLRIALRLGAWYFESLTKGLVQLRGADVNQGERCVEKGESLVRKGNAIIDSGKRVLHAIVEYRSNGKHALRPAVTGRAYVDQVKTKIVQGKLNLMCVCCCAVVLIYLIFFLFSFLFSPGETIVQQGEDVKQQGLHMLAKGFDLMPRIPKRRSLKRYFERQVKLATFQSSVPPEMFESQYSNGMQEEEEDEQGQQHDEELLMTADVHKTKSTTESTGTFLMSGAR